MMRIIGAFLLGMGAAIAFINPLWVARERHLRMDMARIHGGIRDKLEAAVDDAWGKEESKHWMRIWCPDCEHVWSSLRLEDRCALCNLCMREGRIEPFGYEPMDWDSYWEEDDE